MQGAAGVVVNSPAPPEMIEQICAVIDIPVNATVVRCDAVAHAKVKAGAKILNVAAGKDTPAVLRELREIYPNLPLIGDAVAHAKVKAGAKILNVAAGKDTPAVLRELREIYPNLPLIASGGRSALSVRETFQAVANAVFWTPPSAPQLQADMMRRYREAEVKPEVPIMDPVAAADVNPLDSARADVPIPDELIAKAPTGGPKRQRPCPPLFFKGRRH